MEKLQQAAKNISLFNAYIASPEANIPSPSYYEQNPQIREQIIQFTTDENLIQENSTSNSPQALRIRKIFGSHPASAIAALDRLDMYKTMNKDDIDFLLSVCFAKDSTVRTQDIAKKLGMFHAKVDQRIHALSVRVEGHGGLVRELSRSDREVSELLALEESLRRETFKKRKRIQNYYYTDYRLFSFRSYPIELYPKNYRIY